MKLPRLNDRAERPVDTEWDKSFSDRLEKVRSSIRSLERKAYSGGYLLSAFIVLSIGATRNFSFLPSFSQSIRKSMGAAPPASMISIALTVYVFSAVILSLSRMMEGTDKVGGVSHLGYLGAFFFFYHLSGEMDSQFWAVFAAGATILALESYQRWHYCRYEILKEREVLRELEALSRRRALSENLEDTA